MDVRRRPRDEIPLIEELAVFVEHLEASVVAVVHVHTPRFWVDGDSVDAVEVAGAPLVGRRSLHSPLQKLLAVHVVLDDACAVIAVGQIPGVLVHEGHERRPAEMGIVGARYTRCAQRQQTLFAVMRELADEVVIGIHDPDIFFRIVGADLDVVRPAPDLVPLRPVLRLDPLDIAIDEVDDELPSPSNPRPAISSISCSDAAAGCGTGRFAYRQTAADGELDARPNLRKPGGPAPELKDRQLALLRHEYAVGTLGKNVGGLRPGPCLMGLKGPSPLAPPGGPQVVGSERVLSAFE